MKTKTETKKTKATYGNIPGLSNVKPSNPRLFAISEATTAKLRAKPARKADTLVALNLSIDRLKTIDA
jgi:hypothetical protein